jgi:hypothetical protein
MNINFDISTQGILKIKNKIVVITKSYDIKDIIPYAPGTIVCVADILVSPAAGKTVIGGKEGIVGKEGVPVILAPGIGPV